MNSSIFKKILDKIKLGQKERALPNLPNTTFISRLAYYGIDKAIIASKFIKIRKKNYIETILKYRPRFKQIYENSYDLNSLQSFKTVNEILLNLPMIYLIKPIGRGKFLHLKEFIDRDIKVSEFIEILNDRKDRPSYFNEISEIEIQATSSLIFHSQIVNDFLDKKSENDVLDYLFVEYIEKRDLFKIFGQLQIENRNIFLKNILSLKDFEAAINNLTIDLIRATKKWQNSSFDQIFSITSQLPRRLMFDKNRISLIDKEYPNDIKKLSVFIIASMTNNISTIKKIETLHRLGLKRIQDLILFSPDFRPLFKDFNLLKKINKVVRV